MTENLGKRFRLGRNVHYRNVNNSSMVWAVITEI